MLSLEQITNAARIAAKEFPIKSVELFGSYAEGRAGERSDVDLLVEFDTPAHRPRRSHIPRKDGAHICGIGIAGFRDIAA